MSEFTRNFTLVRTRCVMGAIVDAAGWAGRWPFRRAISYHVGVNCDAIAAVDGRIYVYRRGWTIAVAEPLGTAPSFWAALLFPRHARSGEPDRAASAKSPWAS